MTFFRDDLGHIHVPRLAGALYVAGLILTCRGEAMSTPLCIGRAIFTLGWWIAFGPKQQPRSVAAIVRNPNCLIGVALIVGGLVEQFYITRAGLSIRVLFLVLLVAGLSVAGGMLYGKYYRK